MSTESNITQAQVTEYVHQGGGHCPHCGSDQISGGHIEVSGTEAWQEVSCMDCEAEWQDLYEMVGVGNPDGDAVYAVPPAVRATAEEVLCMLRRLLEEVCMTEAGMSHVSRLTLEHARSAIAKATKGGAA